MQNLIKLRDFYLAAYLVATGIKLHSAESVPGGTLFIFADNASSKTEVEQYYSMSAMVEPVSYGTAIKNLKSIVHKNKTKSESEEQYNVKQYRGTKRA